MLKKFLFILFSIFLLNCVFSICPDEPLKVEIKSEGETFQISNGTALLKNGLTNVDFVYTLMESVGTQSEIECKEGKVFNHILTNRPSKPNPSSITYTRIGSSFKTELTFSETFSSGTSNDFDVSVSFGETFGYTVKIDDANPVFSAPRLDLIIKKGEQKNFTFSAEDNIEISKITFTGSENEVFDNFTNPTVENSFSLNTNTNGFYAFDVEIEDLVGFKSSYSYSTYIDGEAPRLVSLDYGAIKKEITYRDSKYYGVFEFVIEDYSFKDSFNLQEPKVIADLSNLKENTSQTLYCVKLQEQIQKKCRTQQIQITKVSQTNNIPITLTLEDALGNSINIQQNIEIKIDKQSPIFKILKLTSKEGKEENIISSRNSEIELQIKLEDDDTNIKVDFEIEENTGLQLQQKFKKLPKSTSLNYFYNATEFFREYLGSNNLRLTLGVKVTDSYGNFNFKKLNITIDNKNPEISEIIIEDLSSIKDELFTSYEDVKIKAKVFDENLKTSGSLNVYGNFSKIAINKENVKAISCDKERSDLTYHTCIFSSFELKKGHRKENITIKVYDKAGNFVKKNLEVEIFKKGNETPNIFEVKDEKTQKISVLEVIAPISRNLVKNSDPQLWFKGIIEKENEASNSRLHSFHLSNCNASIRDALSITRDYGIYPEETQFFRMPGDEEFVFKLEMVSHENSADLTNVTTTCQMRIDKIENGVITNEVHNLTLEINFYSLPYGSVAKANAKEILDIIEDSKLIRDKTGEFLKYYDVFSNLCSTVGEVSETVSYLSDSWLIVSLGLRLIPGFGESIIGGVDEKVFGTQTKVNTFLNYPFIKKSCGFVTCSNEFNKIIKELPLFRNLEGFEQFFGEFKTQCLKSYAVNGVETKYKQPRN